MYYIILWKKKSGVPPSGGIKVSRQRWWVGRGGGGVVATWENQKSPFWKIYWYVWSWNLLCILEMSFASLLSQEPGEISILTPVLAKFSNFGLYFTENRLFLSSVIIMTSLWRHTWDFGTYFGMYGKRRPLATGIGLLWYQLDVSGGGGEGVSFSQLRVGGNHPLGKTFYIYI